MSFDVAQENNVEEVQLHGEEQGHRVSSNHENNTAKENEAKQEIWANCSRTPEFQAIHFPLCFPQWNTSFSLRIRQEEFPLVFWNEIVASIHFQWDSESYSRWNWSTNLSRKHSESWIKQHEFKQCTEQCESRAKRSRSKCHRDNELWALISNCDFGRACAANRAPVQHIQHWVPQRHRAAFARTKRLRSSIFECSAAQKQHLSGSF